LGIAGSQAVAEPRAPREPTITTTTEVASGHPVAPEAKCNGAMSAVAILTASQRPSLRDPTDSVTLRHQQRPPARSWAERRSSRPSTPCSKALEKAERAGCSCPATRASGRPVWWPRRCEGQTIWDSELLVQDACR